MSKQSLMFSARAALQEGFKRHGPRFPFIIGHRFGLYTFRKSFGRKAFQLDGQSFCYLIHPLILDNERAVEIPVAREFLRSRPGDILEVGNVLPHYFHFPHDVVDKYEQAPGVVNEDVVNYAPGKLYDAIVTISTLEHVGWDENPRDPEKLPRAIARLRGLLKPTGEMIATVPMGYNSHLDTLIRERRTGFPRVRYMKRVSSNNLWQEATLEEVAHAKFGTPFKCANAIMIGYARGAETLKSEAISKA